MALTGRPSRAGRPGSADGAPPARAHRWGPGSCHGWGPGSGPGRVGAEALLQQVEAPVGEDDGVRGDRGGRFAGQQAAAVLGEQRVPGAEDLGGDDTRDDRLLALLDQRFGELVLGADEEGVGAGEQGGVSMMSRTMPSASGLSPIPTDGSWRSMASMN